MNRSLHSRGYGSSGCDVGGNDPRRLRLTVNRDLPTLFVAVYSHDDGADGLREGDGGIENETAAADLGDAVGLAVDVQSDPHLGRVGPAGGRRNDRV